MENTLQFDLNEIVSAHVTEEIRCLQELLNKSRAECIALRQENSSLVRSLKDAESTNVLLNKIRTTFSAIDKSEQDDGGWYKSKQQNQYLFIKELMSTLFGVKELHGGWKSNRGDGSLKTYLAVNFYENKDIATNLLKVLKENNSDDVKFIDQFVMPYDYTKKEVLEYVKRPKYNTNGQIFEISQYWIEAGAGKANMPHSLIMKSPHILEDDVFEELIKSIKNKVSEYCYLFSVGKYNREITLEQTQELGECLITTPTNVWAYDNVEKFISKNLTTFNKTTLDFLYSKISDDNQFRMLHWEKFPVEYQYKYLMDKSTKQILKLLENYSCKWTDEEKETFLKQYFLNKK